MLYFLAKQEYLAVFPSKKGILADLERKQEDCYPIGEYWKIPGLEDNIE
jgi:hypothetical protein